jgi:hypothetical protein
VSAIAGSKGWVKILAAGTVGIAGLALSGCSFLGSITNDQVNNNSATSSDDSSSATGDNTDVFALMVGDCLDDPEADGEEVFDVTTVDCAAAHDNEIYDSIILPDGEFPGAESIDASSSEGCIASFSSFAGIAYEDSARLEYFPFYPTEESWANGDREILCAIYALDEAGLPTTSTGTLEGANM